jgi:DNA-binding response OmpR family regulator
MKAGANISGLVRASETGCSTTCAAVQPPGVLTITADLRLYSSVVSAAAANGWAAHWARSLQQAVEISAHKPALLVVYDSQLPNTEWTCAFETLATSTTPQRILLATVSIDEQVWRSALRHGGYDVVRRSAGTDELARMLRFAWQSLSRIDPV